MEDSVRQTATDLAVLTAGEVDICMRAEQEARNRCRVLQAEVEVAKARLDLATAEWRNAQEDLDAARVRFSVGWPEVRKILGSADG